jgi:pimeloyl-ACP methyl ester carboxylesterase
MKISAAMTEIQGERLATVLFDDNGHRGDVILIHGFTGSKEDFTEIATLVAQHGYRVLTFDNRGQHESSHSNRPDAYSIDSFAKDVVDLAADFGMTNPHLLGHSFGGLVAQRATTLVPHVWKSLTLMCSGPGGRTEWDVEPAFENLGKVTMEEIWFKHFDEERKAHPRYEIHKRRWIASDGLSTAAQGDLLVNQPSLVEEIAQLKIPTHVIYGENDDAWPIPDQNRMANELGAEVSVLANCGHCPNEDNPELTSRELTMFWDQVKN